MKAKELPIYFYHVGTSTQLGTGKAIIYLDDATVAKYNSADYDDWVTLYSWADQQFTSVGKVVNEFLGIPLINKSQTLYTATKIGYDTFPAWCVTAKDTIGLYSQLVVKTDNSKDIQAKAVSGNEYQQYLAECFYDNQSPFDILTLGANVAPIQSEFYIDSRDHHFYIYECVRPENLFDSDGNEQIGVRIEFYIAGTLSDDHTTARTVTIRVKRVQGESLGFVPLLNASDAQLKDKDVDNPYDDDDDDGDDGDGTDPTITEAVDIPDLPTVGASDFVTIYNPTSSNLNALSDFLWSADNIFDLDNYKKLYADPMECLIGLAVLPCVPDAIGTKNIRFGNVDTGVNSNYLTSQWAKVNCGSVSIKTVAGSFMDYSPHVKIQIYLPYIGFQPLDPDDLMGASLQVVYHVDVLSGDCIAFLKHSKRGVIYSYTGNCIANIPMTAGSYAGALRNYYEQLASVFPAMISGGISGGAAGAAASGIGKLAGAAESIAFNTRPTYQRSGVCSGSAGIMGVQKPFVIIERPNVSVPEYVQNYAGLSANVTMKLGSLHGFTTCDYVHIEGLRATEAELNEIEALLHSGVIL